MKIKLKKPVRRDWISLPFCSGAVFEKDIGVGHGKLKAKLIVFERTKHLRSFWKRMNGFELGRTCQGAVNGMYTEVLNFGKEGQTGAWLECDPRYFCVIGLVREFLSIEVISHEAVHAAFAFAKRKSRSPWDQRAQDMDEEAICYPAGRLAAEINRVLHRAKLFR